MASVANPEAVHITVNDIELEVPKGELIVESVKRLGLEIPIFCYHPRLKPVGMCRMCLVEVGFRQQDGSVRKMPKPQAACTLPASEGMAVYTDSEQVHKDRKGVLEFILANHPLDCPICDRGGECPLQNNTLFYGPSTSRFIELKRHAHKAFPLSKHVTLDLERCIQCGRCVRFTEEISGDSQLAFRYRGAQMQPSTFKLTDFDSKFSGNVIEICPVGALTSADYRFRARPWDLQTSPGICTQCSNGCNVWLDHRVGKLVRVNGRTNEAVNEEWTCDRGKFGHDHLNAPDRLLQPTVREGDGFIPIGWDKAYGVIADAFKTGGDHVAALVSPTVSNEALYLLKRLFNEGFGSPNLDHRWTATNPAAFRNDLLPIAEYENRSSILLFGTSLSDEEPILYLRVRKAWANCETKIVVANDSPTDADDFANVVLRYKTGTGHIVAEYLAKGGDAKSVEAQTGVATALLAQAIELLNDARAATIATSGLFAQVEADRIVAALASMPGAFSLYSRESNEQGALEIGFIPAAGGLDTRAILTAAAEGKLKALWLVNSDPTELWIDKELATKALENVEFLVYQGTNHCEAAQYASIVLPMAAPTEQDGTWTNIEGRVQLMKRAMEPPGEAKPGWRIFSECTLRLKLTTPRFSALDVLESIRADVPTFGALDLTALDGEGALLAGEPAATSAE